MILCAAQIQSKNGDLAGNIQKHVRCINQAVDNGADLILFPELSLTSYEPMTAHRYPLSADTNSLQVFQEVADQKGITICVGAPSEEREGLNISMFIYRPKKTSLSYSKQFLHEDEKLYFTEGSGPIQFGLGPYYMAPAICYESLLEDHAKQFSDSNLSVYLASVSKPENGVKKAKNHYPIVAKKYGFAVLMSNAIGPADNLLAAGQSAYWNKNGDLLTSLNSVNESLLIIDTVTDSFEELPIQ
jgi:predicted amidohydrolase